MALLFSAVTLTGDDDQVELLVPGIPKESNDLRGWTAYENFIASIDHEQEIRVHVAACLYGEGQPFFASPEEIAYFTLRAKEDDSFLCDHCSHAGHSDFQFTWSPEMSYGKESVTYNPCLPDGMGIELEAKWATEHYGLDTSYGWVICRDAFPWEYKRRPDIKRLSLTMEQQPVSIPGPHFTVKAPGDSFRFVHPVSQTAYTLTAQELEQQTLPKNSFGSDRWFYPTHFTAMSYTLSPEASERITVSDSDDSDKPLEIMPDHDSFASSASSNAACIGIIGGADGPTAVVFGASSQGKLCTACSALHFEPVQHDIEWRITFHEKRYHDFSLTLISECFQTDSCRFPN